MKTIQPHPKLRITNLHMYLDIYNNLGRQSPYYGPLWFELNRDIKPHLTPLEVSRTLIKYLIYETS